MIPAAGVLLIIQGISEVFRSIICIQTGQWPARLVVAEETMASETSCCRRNSASTYESSSRRG